MDEKIVNDNHLYRNISLFLSSEPDCCSHKKWWIVNEVCNDTLYERLLSRVPLNDCKYIMMYLFNDKTFPEGLSFISGLGYVYFELYIYMIRLNIYNLFDPCTFL